MSEKTIFNKMLAIQSELKAPKGQFNKFGNYKYRSCEDILEALKPLLAKHKACLTIEDEIIYIEGRFYIKAIACLFDETSKIHATAYAREPEQKKGMDSAQITGATSSYARKYALNGLLCIDDNKDDPDNKKPSDNEPAKKAKKSNKKDDAWKIELGKNCDKKIVEKIRTMLQNGSEEKAIKTLFESNSIKEFENYIRVMDKITMSDLEDK